MECFHGRGFPEIKESKRGQEVERVTFIGYMEFKKNKETVSAEVSACRLQ